MSTIIILVAVGLLVWLYTMGYLLQAILCFGAVLGVGVLHEPYGRLLHEQAARPLLRIPVHRAGEADAAGHALLNDYRYHRISITETGGTLVQILNKIGLIIAFTGLIGMFFFPDILSGYSKAERMGRVKYADTPKRRKKKWLLVLLFLGIIAVGLERVSKIPTMHFRRLELHFCVDFP